MAEIEIGILVRQALAKPLPNIETFKKQVKSWTQMRNRGGTKVNWQFTTKEARIKLKKLYPKII
jgi:hypothetical protein